MASSAAKKNGLNFTTDDEGWEIGGNTFNVKDKIKQGGGRWNPDSKKWRITKDKMSPEEFDSFYEDLLLSLP